jgi:hypothetical protein
MKKKSQNSVLNKLNIEWLNKKKNLTTHKDLIEERIIKSQKKGVSPIGLNCQIYKSGHEIKIT